MPTSYAPEFKVFGDPKFYRNAERYATEAEAQQSASARYAVWTMAEEYRVTEAEEPVNYAIVDGQRVSVPA